MEIRRIVHQYGSFQFLKPKDSNGDWHRYGERKSVKAVNDAIESRRYCFSIDCSSLQILNDYRQHKGMQELRAEEGDLVTLTK